MVIPSTIPNTREELETEMKLLSRFAPLVQVDICDGIFVPNKTWPYNGRDVEFFNDLMAEDVGWPEWEKVEVEVHLMVTKPEEVVEEWIKSGVSSVVAHIEATDNFQKVIDLCRARDVSLGVALKPSTDCGRLAPFANQVDFIQVMGSDVLGKHGVPLQDEALAQIKTLHTHYPERIIGIDIGVTEETIERLRVAGATRFVVGRSILEAENPEEAYKRLNNELRIMNNE